MKLDGFADPVKKDSGGGEGPNLDSVVHDEAGATTNSRSVDVDNGSAAFSYKAAVLGASVGKNNITNDATKSSVAGYTFSHPTRAVNTINNNNKNATAPTAGKLSSISGAAGGIVDAKVSGSKGGFGSGSRVSRSDGKDMPLEGEPVSLLTGANLGRNNTASVEKNLGFGVGKEIEDESFYEQSKTDNVNTNLGSSKTGGFSFGTQSNKISSDDVDHSRNGNFGQVVKKGLSLDANDCKVSGTDFPVDSGNGVREEDRNAFGRTDKDDMPDDEAPSVKRNNIERKGEELGKEVTTLSLSAKVIDKEGDETEPPHKQVEEDELLSELKRKSSDDNALEGSSKLMRVADEVNDGLMDWEIPSADQYDKMEVDSKCDSDCFSFESINDDLDLDVAVASTFDIKVLQKSVELSASALDLVCGKDVIMVVGKTGVGKSTLIQGIAGKKINTAVHEATFTGNTALKQVYDVQEPMAEFRIGHDAKSMTSHLSAFLRSDDKGTETVYLDSPGMEDTSGVEMDIATSALFSQVAKRCRSLKFIVVIHCASLIEDRGGAFRSVLKFARRFASDFYESKKSFMFLFSHTNEIAEMSDSTDNAKKRLRDEIIRTAQGTKDKDVVMVLQFIRQSIEKEYPFAGIYRPLEMDFPALTLDAERKLKKMTNLALASCCNLTTASTLKLEGAVQTLIHRMRESLRGNSPDHVTLRDILNTLHYLNTYVEVDCVRKAAEESKVIMEEQIDTTKSRIEGHVIRGLHLDTEFSAENASFIKDSLLLLKELDDSFSIEHWHKGNRKRLIEFKQDILRNLLCSSFYTDAKKLSIWASEFSEYSDLYSKLCDEILRKIQDIVTKLSETDTSGMAQGSKDEIASFMACYSQFYTFCERAVKFPLTGIDSKDFVAVRDAITQQLIDLLGKWSSNTMKLVPENLEKMIDSNLSLWPIANHVVAIEVIEEELRKQEFVSTVLMEKTKAVRRQIESHIISWYATSCNMLKEMGVHQKMECCLVWMRDTCRLFSDMNGDRWRSLQAAYTSLVEKATAIISSIAQDLLSRCKMLRQNGMGDGKQIAREFNFLQSLKWFDTTFSRTGFSHVGSYCSEINAIVGAHTLEKKKQLDSLIEDFGSESLSTCAINSMGSLLPELRQIDQYESSISTSGPWDSLSSKCIASLEDYVATLHQNGCQYIEQWAAGFQDGQSSYMRTMSKKLNRVLGELRALQSTRASSDLIGNSANLSSMLDVEFQKCTAAINAEFTSLEGDYEKKVAYLKSLLACQESFLVAERLPKFNDLQHQLRLLLSSRAQDIEREIEESSEWDSIDGRLEAFKCALVLDSFVDQEVTHRLNTLRRMREQKESNVEVAMQDMITEQKFQQIGEFLSPLASSKDQLKKQKYLTYQSEIAVGLEEIIHKVNRLLDHHSSPEQNAKVIAQNLDILLSAKPELQRLLVPRLNISKELKGLKEKLNMILRIFTDSMDKAIKSRDFVQLLINRRKANMFHSSTEVYMYANSKKCLDAIKRKAKSEIDAIPTYVELFFSSSFEQVNNLVQVMVSLKESLDHEDKYFEKLHNLYTTTKQDIDNRTRKVMSDALKITQNHQVYDDVIPVVHALNRILQGPLKSHCSPDLLNECSRLVDNLRAGKEKHDHWFEFDVKQAKQKIEEWSEKMDKLESSSWSLSGFISNKWSGGKTITYETYQKRLLRIVESRFNQGNEAIKTRDIQTVQECLDILKCVAKFAKKHVGVAVKKLNDLRTTGIRTFCNLCKQAEQILESGSPLQFEELFYDYQSFSTKMPCILESDDGKKGFALVNQLLFEHFEHTVAILRQTASGEIIDFSNLRLKLIDARSFGNFLADNLTVLREQTKDFFSEKWLEKIDKQCWKYCGDGRNLGSIKYCAILGVPPSASESDIKKAFKEKALLYHPDKCIGDGAMFRSIKEAQDKLLEMSHLTQANLSRPFDDILIHVGEHLRSVSKKLMQEQQYELVEKMLFQLPNLKVISDLVTPALECDAITKCIYETVKHIVESARIEIDSNWKARKYKELNDNISDLKLMENHFSAYPQIFSLSWDTGITKKIESEIESLGKKGSLCLESHVMAKQNVSEFRRIFIEMGFVLVELPLFKAFTKRIMSDVLESCLDMEWGYGYLFEIGLSLQKGDESCSDDENRIAQMLITEFSHFKEVQTMVWNEETSQKPAEEVVAGINGEQRVTTTPASKSDTLPINIDKVKLLASFEAYDREYKSLLGDYLKLDADLNVLVHKTIAKANRVKPKDASMDFDDELKGQIPALLASVFALFTVLKSGASYNRIESAGGGSVLGIKLLMKPHNIQVLTLLHMFGCSTTSNSSLQSQLMQIRTGEGKSMILGAAAVMLGLLGFKVRTVCYSEYLSARDYSLFEELFERFGLKKFIKYSKITTFAEDSTATKGDIRSLTECLLRGNLTVPSYMKSMMTTTKEALRSLTSKVFVNSSNDANSPKSTVDNNLLDSSSMSSENIVEGETVETGVANRTRSKKHSSPNSKSSQENSQQVKRKSSVISSELSAASPANAISIDCQQTSPTFGDSNQADMKEVLLVDEVDVFFGSEFYGQTYNQVVEFREPEVFEILKRIWTAFDSGSRHLKLNDIKSMPEYTRLLDKLPGYLLDNEISLMLDQVRRVDDVPYYIHPETDRIGYKVMDYISYDVTYGYRTIFAYLKESDNLKKKDTLANALVMPISCGQFSYANISPYRIIGVSGTLQALGDYEKEVLAQYGLSRSIFVPSVYGASNFQFDKAGDGIYFEDNKSNFYHRLSAEITSVIKTKRSVIVFFRDRTKLDEFVSSPTYRQLGRHKKLLTEDTNSLDKEYIINKAATAGQITLCTKVFGRGTDFFCKDEAVENNGGVHIIQTFLSEEISEEIQIQGRTARQGKQGTYQLILLETDLVSEFGVSQGDHGNIPKRNWYEWLCTVRKKHHDKQCKIIETTLLRANEVDKLTHKYFDSLIKCDSSQALTDFQSLYQTIKKPPFPPLLNLDLAFAIDVTGSMMPFTKCIANTIQRLVDGGQNSIVEKLKAKFPEIEFKMRSGCLGYRDIDDKQDQFQEGCFTDGCHFTEDESELSTFINAVLNNTSGGFDLAEDHLGAINQCTMNWNHSKDWTSEIKCILLFTDAPAHGYVPTSFSGVNNSDNYSVRHPSGLTVDHIASSLVKNNIDLFFCSFNPVASERVEDELAQAIKDHPDSANESGVARIPMVPENKTQPSLLSGCERHIIFVLDESGSMQHNWTGVVKAYNGYLSKRKQSQCDGDLVSVVQFNNGARVTVNPTSLSSAPSNLPYDSGGTCFHPAAIKACQMAKQTPSTYTTTIIFMSDGRAGDAPAAAREFSGLNSQIFSQSENDLELHVIAFGTGANNAQLQQIAGASKVGKVHLSSNTADLAKVFVDIAANTSVATTLESEITKRISEAVSDKLSLEYFGS